MHCDSALAGVDVDVASGPWPCVSLGELGLWIVLSWCVFCEGYLKRGFVFVFLFVLKCGTL